MDLAFNHEGHEDEVGVFRQALVSSANNSDFWIATIDLELRHQPNRDSESSPGSLAFRGGGRATTARTRYRKFTERIVMRLIRLLIFRRIS